MQVKLPPGAPRSSFGVPAEIREQMEKQRQDQVKKEEVELAQEPETSPYATDDYGMNLLSAEEIMKKEEERKKENDIDFVKKALKDLDVEITEEDVHSVLFKGYCEKDMLLFNKGSVSFRATIRTLTAEELSIADEMLMESAKGKQMTNDGFEYQKSLLHLCFAAEKLQGKTISKPIYDKGEVDLKATAYVKYAILKKSSFLLLDKMTQSLARLTLGCRLLMEDPSSPL